MCKVLEPVSSIPWLKRGAIHEFESMGIVTFTVTNSVSSLIGEGVTSMLETLTPAAASTLFASAMPSATLAPGTMMCRHAS